MEERIIKWLMESNEPWTRYRTLVDLLDKGANDTQVIAERDAMLAHPAVRTLIHEVAHWPGTVLKRHNDAGHILNKFCVLADFGVLAGDQGMAEGLNAILAHQSKQDAFQTLLFIPAAFGGPNVDTLGWVACDAPSLLYILLAMGFENDERVKKAILHLNSLSTENGWRCVCAPELGKFRGPGRKDDPCPVANVYALKALSMLPEMRNSPEIQRGVETLLLHWDTATTKKQYLFGSGPNFRKIKYPFVYYDILHVAEVLSRFSYIHSDPRFQQIVTTITDQADTEGHFRAGSMYTTWKGWSFADKKQPSPWISFLILRILKRIGKI